MDQGKGISVSVGLSKRLSMEAAAGCVDVFLSNCRSNLPIIRAVPGVKNLASILAGEKVVVAAAGPSLDAAIPVLARHRPFLVAVDRAVRPLMAANIRPDWIVSVDKDPLTAEKMRGIKGLDRIPLIFHPCVTPKTVQEYPGPLLTFDCPDLVLGKGALALGTCVLTSAVGVAQLMGGNPIILAGADLGYPSNCQTHASGIPYLAGDGEAARFDVPSTDGGSVKSDVFLTAQVEELARFKGNLIQTAPRGAAIPGWEFRRLEDVL